VDAPHLAHFHHDWEGQRDIGKNPLSLGARMELYQVRIAKGNDELIICERFHVSDYAAIRHACSIAENCDHVEVWRGAVYCVFSGPPTKKGREARFNVQGA
jgi:hypothetical protein